MAPSTLVIDVTPIHEILRDVSWSLRTRISLLLALDPLYLNSEVFQRRDLKSDLRKSFPPMLCPGLLTAESLRNRVARRGIHGASLPETRKGNGLDLSFTQQFRRQLSTLRAKLWKDSEAQSFPGTVKVRQPMFWERRLKPGIGTRFAPPVCCPNSPKCVTTSTLRDVTHRKEPDCEHQKDPFSQRLLALW